MASTFAEVLARNARAARTRAGIDQATVASRMSRFGFGTWVRQTVTKVERGERRLTAEEILGLSVALGVTVAELMSPADQDGDVLLPSGDVLDGKSVQYSARGYYDTLVTFDETGKPEFTPRERLARMVSDLPPLRVSRGPGSA